MPLDPPKFIERNAKFNAAGRLLYGERWQSAVAAGIGRPITTINSIATGRRAVTGELEWQLALLIGNEIERRKREAEELAQMAKGLKTLIKDEEL